MVEWRCNWVGKFWQRLDCISLLIQKSCFLRQQLFTLLAPIWVWSSTVNPSGLLAVLRFLKKVLKKNYNMFCLLDIFQKIKKASHAHVLTIAAMWFVSFFARLFQEKKTEYIWLYLQAHVHTRPSVHTFVWSCPVTKGVEPGVPLSNNLSFSNHVTEYPSTIREEQTYNLFLPLH